MKKVTKILSVVGVVSLLLLTSCVSTTSALVGDGNARGARGASMGAVVGNAGQSSPR